MSAARVIVATPEALATGRDLDPGDHFRHADGCTLDRLVVAVGSDGALLFRCSTCNRFRKGPKAARPSDNNEMATTATERPSKHEGPLDPDRVRRRRLPYVIACRDCGANMQHPNPRPALRRCDGCGRAHVAAQQRRARARRWAEDEYTLTAER